VTEYCAGGSLAKFDSSSMPMLARLGLFHAICLGVGHGHQNGIVHRDIKPLNIFLRADHTPVVGDYGLCYLADGQELTTSQEAVGARFYIAPELEHGPVERPQPYSDVYSLGKLLYWLMSGGRMFAREGHRSPGYNLLKADDSAWYFIYDLLDITITADIHKRPDNANTVASLT
jgi:serine/threonine protein kinase